MNISLNMQDSTKTFLKIAFVVLAFFAIVLKMDHTNVSLQMRLDEQEAVLTSNVEELEKLQNFVRQTVHEKQDLELQVSSLKTILSGVEQDRARMVQQLREKEVKLNNALIPESSWQEAGEKRVVEPTVETFDRVTTYVKSLF